MKKPFSVLRKKVYRRRPLEQVLDLLPELSRPELEDLDRALNDLLVTGRWRAVDRLLARIRKGRE